MRLAALAQREGFSLAETAFSIAILAAVIGALVPGLLAFRTADQARATQTRLEAVMRASANFAQVNGCLPCPTPQDFQSTTGRGAVRGDTSANPAACGVCPGPVGLVPFRSLGLPESFARDGYGHWMTFAVDASLTISGLSDVACKTGDTDPACTLDDIAHSNHKKGLCKANLSATGNPLTVTLPGGGTQKAAVLVLSHGANGRGAYSEENATLPNVIFPSKQPKCSATGGFERCNAAGTGSFVAAIPTGGTDAFDDQMLYLDRNALLANTGGATCQTVW